MPLAAGARVGAFEILARLGAGGMGEVYRARDTRLDRIIALKLLRASERPGHPSLERFKREARAISRLNHPHICALHDIGEQDGEAFLVMEYVHGETLAERLALGALRIEEVLRFGIQIAGALSAAHREGVVHRDLKPSNIMLARDGVKLLDFGLAKLREGDAAPTDQDATMSLALSGDGSIIGTLPYMAPEQLEGRPVDARTDLFALGAVLYEMTTGQAPFQGSSKASVIVAILSEDPVPVSTRQPLTPPLLERVIQRCLAKEPDARWQTAADLGAELTYVGKTLTDHPTAAPSARHRPSRRMAMLATALATIAGMVAAAIPLVRGRQLSEPSFHHVTFRRGIITSARFAPDGQSIVYSAAWEGQPYELYLTRYGSTESRPLGIPHGRLFAISQSDELAFMQGRQSVFRAVGTLARMPLTGGAPRELLEDITSADWTPDGTALAVVRQAPGARDRLQVEFPVGTKLYETPLHVTSLRVSPRGDRVAFLEGNQSRELIVLDRSGKKTTLFRGWNISTLGLAWSPDEKEIWFTGTLGTFAPSFYAAAFDGTQRLLARVPDPVRLEDRSRDGRVLAVRDLGREGVACRAPGEISDRDLSWFDGSSLEALSADGRTTIFGEIRGGGGLMEGVYLRKTDGSPAIRLADGYPEDLSPDGRWVLARPNAAPPNSLEKGWVLLPVGAGAPRSLPLGKLTGLFEANFLPDGRVTFGGSEAGRDRRIYVQDTSGGLPRAISPEGVRTAARATPDGRFVEGSSGGKHALYPVDGGEVRVLPFLSAEDTPLQWTSDGRFMYVLRASPWSSTPAEIYQTLEAAIDRVDVSTGARKFWKTIKPVDPVGLDAIVDVRVTPDGGSYCYGYLRTLSTLLVVEGLK
jgi:serine/threonine protein kinase/Tol biopolymer transport system component